MNLRKRSPVSVVRFCSGPSVVIIVCNEPDRCIPAAARSAQTSKIVRDGGRLNLFGWNHGTGSFPGDIWHMHGLTVVNSAPHSAVRDPWPAAIRLLERGYIDLGPLVSHVVPLEEYPALLAKATTRDSGYLKGVVRIKVQ